MCQNALSKRTDKVKKRLLGAQVWARKFRHASWRARVGAHELGRTSWCAQVGARKLGRSSWDYCIFFDFLSSFGKSILTLDNLRDVLRAAFCDSRNVFGEVAQSSHSLTRVSDFFCVERLRDFLCGGRMIFV